MDCISIAISKKYLITSNYNLLFVIYVKYSAYYSFQMILRKSLRFSIFNLKYYALSYEIDAVYCFGIHFLLFTLLYANVTLGLYDVGNLLINYTSLLIYSCILEASQFGSNLYMFHGLFRTRQREMDL